jgi:hypothetical protein
VSWDLREEQNTAAPVKSSTARVAESTATLMMGSILVKMEPVGFMLIYLKTVAFGKSVFSLHRARGIFCREHKVHALVT